MSTNRKKSAKPQGATDSLHDTQETLLSPPAQGLPLTAHTAHLAEEPPPDPNRAATKGPTEAEASRASDERAQRELARKWGMRFLNLSECVLDEEVILAVPAFLLKEHKVLPLELENGTLTLALSDPLNVRAVDEIHMLTGFAVKPVIATEAEILTWLDHYIGVGMGRQEVAELVEDTVKKGESGRNKASTQFQGSASEDLRVGEDEPFIVRLVNLILAQGVSYGASDIHMHPEEDQLRVRYRVDGVLYDAPAHSWRYGQAMIARLKVMAKLDIADKRRAQDGRISVNIQGRGYDLRVSTYPTIYGEKVVMRIAERGARRVPLIQLGFDDYQLQRFQRLIRRPYGMILVTGPTGSGKTTTLYSVLNALNTSDRNIMTVEDPVESRIPGIAQGQVGSTKRSPMTFPTALRHMLRQDPDIVMVGEIRDQETALIATQASLTGHLVLSTLHTNNAAGAASRLLDMGIEPFLVSSSLLGVVAQRLARVLCPRCKEPHEVPASAIQKLDPTLDRLDDHVTVYRAPGCPACNGHGYKGRTGVFELLVITDEVREVIVAEASTQEIARVAQQQGMVTMLQDAVCKVLQGVTSIEEALRVIDAD